jgi:hypothetical protein
MKSRERIMRLRGVLEPAFYLNSTGALTRASLFQKREGDDDNL